MIDNSKDKMSNVDMYKELSRISSFLEQIRWPRFNHLLVVNTILLIFIGVLGEIESISDYKTLAQAAICVMGAFFSICWILLGWRSSKYLDDCNDKIESMEEKDKLHNIKPYTDFKKIRPKCATKITSSKYIITLVPLMFLALFVFLFIDLRLYLHPFQDFFKG